MSEEDANQKQISLLKRKSSEFIPDVSNLQSVLDLIYSMF